MSSQKRRHWKAEEKLQMLEEARKTDSTVSEACPRVRGGMPAIRDRDRSVLYVGETCPSGSPGGIREWEARTEGVQGGRNAKVRDGEIPCGNSRTDITGSG